jgi:hypothetical protein
MTARQHNRPAHREQQGGPAAAGDTSPWLTLTDLGRLYGISAMHCGRLLNAAGLRDPEGHPTAQALQAGCASARQSQRQGGQPFWHRQHCRQAFETAGLETVQQSTLVQQWADLLSALTEGSPSISTSADQMAEELPGELVEPVNLQLRELGCSFQVQRNGRGVSRGAGARNAARPDPVEAAPRKEGRNHGPAGRPRRHAANG